VREWLEAKKKPTLYSIAIRLLSTSRSSQDRQKNNDRNAIWKQIIQSETQYVQTLTDVQHVKI